MKKYLVSFAFAVLFFAGCKSESGVDDLRKEIEALKSTEIASVNSQITGIKSSISDLQKVDAELKGYIKTLQDALTAPDSEIDEKYASLQKDIEDLEKADAALSKRIDELKDYCDQQNSSTREWVATTFTTLEQHSEVLEEIAAIKLQLGELGNSITTLDSSLSKKISDSEDKVMAAIGTTENSVKSWVNEQLSGYYTIAAADAKLKLLEDAYKAGDTSLAGDIKTLQESLNTAKSDLTAAYQKAIADAITENNGTINKKIADDIKAAADNLQSQINAINTRIDALESRVAALEASVAELIGMVQSIVVVPDYSDGSVKMTSSSDNIIRFEVYPLSAAKALAEKGPSVFSLDYVETETKASMFKNIPITSVSFDGEVISIVADGSGLAEQVKSGIQSANARLHISNGIATRSSEYFNLSLGNAPSTDIDSIELLPISDLTAFRAVLSAKVSLTVSCNDDAVYGFIYSKREDDLFIGFYSNEFSPGIDTLKTRHLASGGIFSRPTRWLNVSTKYYYRAFASINGRLIYSDVSTFSTPAALISVETNDAVFENRKTTLKGELYCDKPINVSDCSFWFLYSCSETGLESLKESGIRVEAEPYEDAKFSSSINGLPMGKTCYYVACAQVYNEVAYSEVQSISVPICIEEILGAYSATATSAWSGKVAWTMTLYKDPTDVNVVWIDGVTNKIGSYNNGLFYANIFLDEDGEIAGMTVPSGQYMDYPDKSDYWIRLVGYKAGSGGSGGYYLYPDDSITWNYSDGKFTIDQDADINSLCLAVYGPSDKTAVSGFLYDVYDIAPAFTKK